VEQWQDLDLLLRGMAIGAQLGLGAGLAASASDQGLRIATVLFILGNLCFTINGSHPLQVLLGPARQPLWIIQLGSAAYFWLFVVTLFEDLRFSPRHLVPAAALTAIGLCGHYGPRGLAPAFWMAHNAIGLLLALHALVVIVRSGRNDLVEVRRRLRVPFLMLIAAFSMVLSLAQLGQNIGIDAAWYEFANALAQALLGVAGVVVMLEARPALFGAARPDQAGAAVPALTDDQAFWLARLDQVMDGDSAWRREGVTIAEIARDVGLPEYRLRQLINQSLGHRNFASFINQRRIAAARAMLAAPEHAGTSITSIAFDLGFGSLGPFNRAFREATGVTPTEFRRQAIRQSSPIPENPR